MSKYLVIIEKTTTGYSAYSPDLEGCVATGTSREEVEKNMTESIQLHLEGLVEEGYLVPESKSYSRYIEMPA
jgi:predicted RNase H-like HicB family nuclease